MVKFFDPRTKVSLELIRKERREMKAYHYPKHTKSLGGGINGVVDRYGDGAGCKPVA